MKRKSSFPRPHPCEFLGRDSPAICSAGRKRESRQGVSWTPASAGVTAKCCLICVGSELLRGKLNTHVSTLARRLASIGLALNAEFTVSDELADLAEAPRRALERFEVVFVTGGLGPTFDDLTREAASRATGRPLQQNPRLLRDIRRKFRKANYRMPPANARQAQVLEGAEVIPNAMGTAPGQWLELSQGTFSHREVGEGGDEGRGRALTLPPLPRSAGEGGGKLLILLPGPPRELNPMLDQSVLPRLKKLFPASPQAEAHLHFVGVPESVVDHKIRPVIKRAGTGSIQFTILAHLGLVDLDLFVSAPTRPKARLALEKTIRAIRQAVGKSFYGRDKDYPLEKVVGDHFRRRRWTLAVAESCTGGMLASRLTDIPGSSDYFAGGWVPYANRMKQQELNVPESLLKKHGAVSRPMALTMAQGVCRRAGSAWGLGITGIAGPGGGSRKKPVGLVYVAVASTGKSVCREYRFTGDRDAIRQRMVIAALDLLRSL